MSNVEEIFAKADQLLINQNEIDNYQGPGDEALIRSPKYFLDELLNPEEEEQGCKLPWVKTWDKVRLRQGEVSIWSGYNGHKKSMLLGQVMFDLLTQNQKVCIASLEMQPVTTLKRMSSQAIGNTTPEPNLVVKLINYIEGKLYLFDQQNTVQTERVLKMAKYCCEKLGIDHLVIDSLMKCGMNTDDYNAQKNFINELCAIAKYSESHIHLVAHMRKPSTDKSYMPTKFDILGGSDISNQVDNVFIVWTDQDKKKEKQKPIEYQKKEIIDKPEQKLAIDKQRNGEWEGRCVFEFDNRSLQIIEHQRIDYLGYFQ